MRFGKGIAGFIGILSLAVLFLSEEAQASGNCIPVITRAGDKVAFKSGEKLDFIIHYTFGMVDSDIGTATISLDTIRMKGSKVFRCDVSGRTTRLFDTFFKVRESFQSYFSYDGLVPVCFFRNTAEGDYIAKNEYYYRWSAPEPYIDATVFTTSIGSTKLMNIPLKPCTFDLPALFFFARNIDMDKIVPGRRYPMTFAIDDEVFDVGFSYEGKVNKRVPGFGEVKCLLFYADLLHGQVFAGNADMKLYITDDQNRLPILFSAPLRVGDVEGRMTACSGLKHTMTSVKEKYRQ